RLEAGENYALAPNFAAAKVELTAETVFVGYGLSVPEYGYDDFAGVEVKGKVAVLFAGAPHSDRPDFFPSLASAVHGQVERKVRELMRRGARGVIFVWQPAKEEMTPFRYIAANLAFEQMQLEDSPPFVPGGIISTSAFEGMLRQAGRKETVSALVEAAARGTPHPFDLGVRAHFRIESTLRHLASANVVGLLPGDPASPTCKEMVVYGAHMDHMGIGAPVNGDSIYNGASDDAAGVGSVLETARAFTRIGHPPRRGILLVFVTAEERGLRGSEWVARRSTE